MLGLLLTIVAAAGVRTVALPTDPANSAVEIKVARNAATTIQLPVRFGLAAAEGIKLFRITTIRYRPTGALLVEPQGAADELAVGIFVRRGGPCLMRLHLVVADDPTLGTEVRVVPASEEAGRKGADELAERGGGSARFGRARAPAAPHPLAEASGAKSSAEPSPEIRKGRQDSGEPAPSPSAGAPEGVPAGVESPGAGSSVQPPPVGIASPPPPAASLVVEREEPRVPAGVPLAPPPASASIPEGFTQPDPLDIQTVKIDRTEGLPGQLEMTLEDALRGSSHVWFRFVLKGGRDKSVDRVVCDGNPVATFVQASDGKDLRIVVQLRRARVSRKTGVKIHIAPSGPAYEFSALTSPTLLRFLKDLF